MSVKISGQNLKVTSALRDRVMAKLVDPMTEHFGQVEGVTVRLMVDNNRTEKECRKEAECEVHVKGRIFFAKSAGPDLEFVVDTLADKVGRQVQKHKEKVKQHHGLGEPPKRMAADSAAAG